MLQEVGNEPGALPLLQDVLDVLWQHRQARTITQTAYNELGGVIGALQTRADAIVEKLTAEDLAVARRMIVSLVAVADDTVLDTRLRVSLGDLRDCFAGTDAAAFERLLKQMVAARLLVQDGDGQAAWVEVAHEALIRKWPRLRAWLRTALACSCNAASGRQPSSGKVTSRMSPCCIVGGCCADHRMA